jgi:hypothetical protein
VTVGTVTIVVVTISIMTVATITISMMTISTMTVAAMAVATMMIAKVTIATMTLAATGDADRRHAPVPPQTWMNFVASNAQGVVPLVVITPISVPPPAKLPFAL